MQKSRHFAVKKGTYFCPKIRKRGKKRGRCGANALKKGQKTSKNQREYEEGEGRGTGGRNCGHPPWPKFGEQKHPLFLTGKKGHFFWDEKRVDFVGISHLNCKKRGQNDQKLTEISKSDLKRPEKTKNDQKWVKIDFLTKSDKFRLINHAFSLVRSRVFFSNGL